MEQPFSWRSFDQMARALQSIGYLVVVFGPLVGLAVVIMGAGMMRVVGIGIIGASVFLAMYHMSFSLLMNAMHDMVKRLESVERTGTSA
jgi:hypothetical protein